jgi:hypothetical protein
MGILDYFRRKPADIKTASPLPGENFGGGSELGQRAHPEDVAKRLMRAMWVDPALRAQIMDIRHMDRMDGRVKKIHLRTSRAAAKGGILLTAPGQSKRLQREFESFANRLHLYRRDKVESDIRGLMMEGNLCMQWVLDSDQTGVMGCARMPAETIVPRVSANGTFEDTRAAYEQYDLTRGLPICTFGLWQLTVSRLTPDNYDDFGSLGRPYLDATRAVWRKLVMTEEDLVIRRRMRAPLRMSHVLEGAGPEELAQYRLEVERDQASGSSRDYFLNKKGAVTALQGDANLEQIADVSLLIDTFFAGSPAPKGLFGYSGELSRDILQDLKEDYYDEIDALQDNTAWVYETGFRLHLLLQGLNPDSYDFTVKFAERRIDTPNQRADMGLKLQALGLPRDIVWDAAGVDLAAAKLAKEQQEKEEGPFPEDDGMEAVPGDGSPPSPAAPHVKVTPGNAPKGQSATTISTRSSR